MEGLGFRVLGVGSVKTKSFLEGWRLEEERLEEDPIPHDRGPSFTLHPSPLSLTTEDPVPARPIGPILSDASDGWSPSPQFRQFEAKARDFTTRRTQRGIAAARRSEQGAVYGNEM